jgi:hypothetical protein
MVSGRGRFYAKLSGRRSKGFKHGDTTLVERGNLRSQGSSQTATVIALGVIKISLFSLIQLNHTSGAFFFFGDGFSFVKVTATLSVILCVTSSKKKLPTRAIRVKPIAAKYMRLIWDVSIPHKTRNEESIINIEDRTRTYWNALLQLHLKASCAAFKIGGVMPSNFPASAGLPPSNNLISLGITPSGAPSGNMTFVTLGVESFLTVFIIMLVYVVTATDPPIALIDPRTSVARPICLSSQESCTQTMSETIIMPIPKVAMKQNPIAATKRFGVSVVNRISEMSFIDAAYMTT